MSNPYTPGTPEWALREQMEGRTAAPPAAGPYAPGSPEAALQASVAGAPAAPSYDPGPIMPRQMPAAAPVEGPSTWDRIKGVFTSPSSEELGLRSDTPEAAPAGPAPRVTMATPGAAPQPGQQGGPGANYGPVNLKNPLMVRTPGSPGGITGYGKLAKEVMPQQAAALHEGADAKADATSQAADRGYQVGAAYSMAQDKADEAERKAEEARAIRNQAFDRATQALMDDAEATKNEKIDANRIFNGENGSYNKMLAIIGGALGGYVQARTGRNPFMEAMNAHIERDIANQKSSIEAARGSRKAKHTALMADVDKWGSEEAALMKHKADAWDAVAQQARGMETLAKSDLMKGDAAAMRGDAEAQALQARLDTAKIIAQNTIAPSGGGVAVNPAAISEFVRGGGDPQKLAADANALIKAGVPRAQAWGAALQANGLTSEMRNEQFKAGIGGADGKGINEQTQALSKAEMAAELPKAEAKLTRLKALVDKFGDDLPGVGPIKMKLGKDWKTSWLLSDEGKQVQQEIIGAVNAHFKATGGSVITESEAPRFFMEIFGPDMDPKGVKQWIEKAEQEQQATKATIRAGASPAAAAEYDRRKQAAGGITGGGNYGFKAPR